MLGGVGIENDPLALIWKNVHLKGILVGNRRELDEMTKAIDRNGLKPVIDRRFPFAEAPAAYRHLASGCALRQDRDQPRLEASLTRAPHQ